MGKSDRIINKKTYRREEVRARLYTDVTNLYNNYPLVLRGQVGQNNKQKKRTAEKRCELDCILTEQIYTIIIRLSYVGKSDRIINKKNVPPRRGAS